MICFRSSSSLAVALVWLTVCFSPLAFAQELTSKQQDERLVARMHKSPRGEMIAEGKNPSGPAETGPFSVQAYTVEELRLEKAVSVTINDKRVSADRAWRITLTGGPFQVRAMPATLHIDGKLVGIGVESPNLDSITFVTFDRSLLNEGATLRFSYGGPGGVELSDALHLIKSR